MAKLSTFATFSLIPKLKDCKKMLDMAPHEFEKSKYISSAQSFEL